MFYPIVVTLTDDEIALLDLNIKENCDKLIESFIPVASNIARRFKGVEYDDIQAQAVLGIVVAVNRLKSTAHPNRGGYINKYINKYCLQYLKDFPRVLQSENNDLEGEFFNSTEFEDVISKIIKSSLEQEVVDLGRKGLSIREIAELTGLSRQTVTKVRKTLFARYLKYV